MEKGGPADKAGIQASDVILKFDNKDVANSNELPRIVAATRPGSKVSVQVWRKGEKKDLQIVVGETPDERAAKRPQPARKARGEALAKLGLTLSELTADQSKELNVATGVLVENAEGVAAQGRHPPRRRDPGGQQPGGEVGRRAEPAAVPRATGHARWRCWSSAATGRSTSRCKLERQLTRRGPRGAGRARPPEWLRATGGAATVFPLEFAAFPECE